MIAADSKYKYFKNNNLNDKPLPLHSSHRLDCWVFVIAKNKRKALCVFVFEWVLSH